MIRPGRLLRYLALFGLTCRQFADRTTLPEAVVTTRSSGFRLAMWLASSVARNRGSGTVRA
jgi:hypothetical protein